jgi:hypothetical protein
MSKVEILGTTDVLKIWAWEHQQGFRDPPDEEVFDSFKADLEALMRRMEALMVDKMEAFRHLFLLDAAGHPRQTPATTTTMPSPLPPAGPSHGNMTMLAGPSCLPKNTVAGGGRRDVKN